MRHRRAAQRESVHVHQLFPLAEGDKGRSDRAVPCRGAGGRPPCENQVRKGPAAPHGAGGFRQRLGKPRVAVEEAGGKARWHFGPAAGKKPDDHFLAHEIQRFRFGTQGARLEAQQIAGQPAREAAAAQVRGEEEPQPHQFPGGFFGRARGAGASETRQRKPVFLNRKHPRQRQRRVHAPPAAVAAQLGGHLHHCQTVVWIGQTEAGGLVEEPLHAIDHRGLHIREVVDVAPMPGVEQQFQLHAGGFGGARCERGGEKPDLRHRRTRSKPKSHIRGMSAAGPGDEPPGRRGNGQVNAKVIARRLFRSAVCGVDARRLEASAWPGECWGGAGNTTDAWVPRAWIAFAGSRRQSTRLSR